MKAADSSETLVTFYPEDRGCSRFFQSVGNVILCRSKTVSFEMLLPIYGAINQKTII
jgi:hypothetical protein